MLPAESLARSLRRSSVSTGIGTRRFCPSTTGFSPRPALRIAFSTETIRPLSQTLTVIERGSGTLTAPTWLIGTVAP